MPSSSRPAPDYAWYRDVYMGRAPQGAFERELPKAVAVVGNLIGWNEVTEANEDAYMRAVCAAAESLAAGGAAAGGFTIGSFSMSGDPQGRTAEQVAAGAARMELSTSGLLWAGVA